MSIKLDLNKFTHVKSDDKHATLQHKDGHILTIAIKGLKPDAAEAIKAMAKGGDVLGSEEHKKGISTQGKDIRHAHKAKHRGDKETHAEAVDYAKEEAKGRAEMERHNKPNLKGLAKGGTVKHATRMAEEANKRTPEEHKHLVSESTELAKKQLSHMDERIKQHRPKMALGGGINNPSAGLDFDAYAQEREKSNFAVDHGLPCLNRNCKSHGRPHPNCRCYTGSGWNEYAKGGEVEIPDGIDSHFCHAKLPHIPGCEYYESGGMVNSLSEWYHKHAKQGDFGTGPQATEQAEKFKGYEEHPQERPANPSNDPNPVNQEYAQGGNVPKYAEGDEVESPKIYRDLEEAQAPDIMQVPNKVTPSNTNPYEAEYNKLYNQIKQNEPTSSDQSARRQALSIVSRMKEKDDYAKNAQQRQAQAADQDLSVENKQRETLGLGPVSSQMQAQPEQTPEAQSENEGLAQPPIQAQAEAPKEQETSFAPADAPGMPIEATAKNPDIGSDPLARQAAYEQNYKAINTDLQLHDKQWDQDLRNGHITPQTYEGLFAKQTTPGKIGTLFGLLVSGVGSGMSGQPNAVLGMMQQEIQNDLKAQEQSKANAQNYLRLSQEYMMHKAQVRKLNTDQQIAAFTMAQMYSNRAALEKLRKLADATPPNSPQGLAARQQLASLANSLDLQHANLTDVAAANMAKMRVLGILPEEGQQNQPQSGNEAAFQRQQKGKLMLGPEGEKIADYDLARHIPGVPGQATNPIPQETRQRIQNMNILDDKVRDVLNFAKQNANLKGQFNPSVIKHAKQKAHELTAFYNQTVDSLGMTPGRLNWLEEQIAKNPASLISQAMGSNAALKEIRDSNSNRRELILSGPGGLGFPKQQQNKNVIEREHNGRIILYDAKTKKPIGYKD